MPMEQHCGDGTPVEVVDLRSVARRRAGEARKVKAEAESHAIRHTRLHYVVGIPGAVATSIGAATFFIERVPVVVSVAAVLGSALVALGGFLGEKQLAYLHWRRRALLGAVAEKLEVAAMGREEPTWKRMDALSDEYARADRGEDPRGMS
jgi:hypothetical protein